jgi:hypothetical protein
MLDVYCTMIFRGVEIRKYLLASRIFGFPINEYGNLYIKVPY